MSDISVAKDIQTISTPRVNETKRIFKVLFGRWIVIFSAVIVAILILVAIFAPFISPYDPNEQHLLHTIEQPSQQFPLGTDDLGRDILSRIIWGSRISIMVGVVAVTLAAVIGMSLGIVAGYYGGWVGAVIMRFVDTLLAIPPLLLMLAIASALGSGLFNVLLALGIGMFPTYCRLMNGQILTLKTSDYIVASKSMGANDIRVMFRHLLPNSFPPMLVLITLNMGTAIMMEASLSFLGIGIAPPTATWGAMVSSGQGYLLTNPLMSFIPGFCILLVVLAFNMVGDGMRDALDPRLRGTL
jgi:peptide/nickel transport system permease protein